MVDINKLVESYYDPNNIKAKAFFQLIEEQVKLFEDALPGGAPDETTNFNMSLLRPRITENFGKPGTEDRKLIENFAKNIAPDGDLKTKLIAINSIIAEKKENATIGEILATMVICEILYAIISHFTESAGGFIFEGFLAGLFGGKSIQITKPEDIPGMEAAGKPITDVQLHGKHYSLKLLGEKTEVAGSFHNMVNHFDIVDHIYYLDARRIDGNQGLEFGEFKITLYDFLKAFVDPFLKEVTIKEPVEVVTAREFKDLLSQLIKNKQAIKLIRTTGQLPSLPSNYFTYSPKHGEPLNLMHERQMKLNGADMNKVIDIIFNTPTGPEDVPEGEASLEDYGPFTVKYAETKFEGTKAETLFGEYNMVERVRAAIESRDDKEILRLLKLTPGYGAEEGASPQQFAFTRKQAESIESFEHVGTLMIGEDYMKNAWSMYADLLQETMFPVYQQLKEFSDNVNNYFLGVTDEEGVAEDRKQYAVDAIKNAVGLRDATEDAVEKIEK